MLIVVAIINFAGKSCKQRLITKEHIAMHTNVILLALYSNDKSF